MKCVANKDFWYSFGKEVALWRFDNRMTQKEFAQKCTLSTWTVSNLERGKQEISLDTFMEMERVIGIYAFYMLIKSRYGSDMVSLQNIDTEAIMQKLLGNFLMLLRNGGPKDRIAFYGEQKLRVHKPKTK